MFIDYNNNDNNINNNNNIIVLLVIIIIIIVIMMAHGNHVLKTFIPEANLSVLYEHMKILKKITCLYAFLNK